MAVFGHLTRCSFLVYGGGLYEVVIYDVVPGFRVFHVCASCGYIRCPDLSLSGV